MYYIYLKLCYIHIYRENLENHLFHGAGNNILLVCHVILSHY